MSHAWLAAMTFCATLAADFAWARYTLHVSGKNSHKAALWSAIIVLVGAVTVLSYTQSWWMVFPAAAGAYTGTFLAIRKQEK